MRDEAIAQRDAQIASLQLATASPLSESDRATLQQLTTKRLRQLQRELSESEQDLLNLDKGRKPSTEEGTTKKENRRKELEDAIAQLNQAIANLNELAQKLKS